MALKIDESCTDYFAEVVKFAAEVDAVGELLSALTRLSDYAKGNEEIETQCVIYRDFAPYSFAFLMKRREVASDDPEYKPWFNGGLIYSGPGLPSDGCGPSFTVSLDDDAASGRTHKWSTHT
jgi:hypothetical protein